MTPTPHNWPRPKTRAAFHEAGHCVAALHFGYTVGNVYIRQAAGPLILGQPQFEGHIEFPHRGHSRTDHRIVVVAGEVAEFILLGWADWESINLGLCDGFDSRDLTPENLPLAVSRAVEILTRKWAFVSDIAELLESEERLEAYMVKGLWQCEIAGDYLREKRATGGTEQ